MSREEADLALKKGLINSTQYDWIASGRRTPQDFGITWQQLGLSGPTHTYVKGEYIPTLASGLYTEAGMGGLVKAAAKILPGILTKAKSVFTKGRGKVAAPATLAGLGTAILTKAQQFIQKPLRTSLPYVATGGLLGEAVDYGTKKEEVRVSTGGLIGQAVLPPYLPPSVPTLQQPVGAALPLSTGIPPIDLMAGIPWGVPSMGTQIVAQPPPFVRTWSTGTATFGVDQFGGHWVTTKNGWKKYSKRKPIVLGTRNLTPNKFIAAAKKYHKMYKDLDKIFKKVKVRKRAT